MADEKVVSQVIERPYLRTVEKGEDGIFTAWLVEMPNVLAEGQTADEALKELEDAFAGVVHVMLDEGRDIPDPFRERNYSGRLQLRMPPSLHRLVAERAEAAGVSLNRVLSDAVARYVGFSVRAVGSGPQQRRAEPVRTTAKTAARVPRLATRAAATKAATARTAFTSKKATTKRATTGTTVRRRTGKSPKK
jgi:antitoxin HicB